MDSACISSHLPFKVLQLQKYFITTPVKVTGRSPAQAEHTSTRNQRVTQNPSNGMAKIKTIDYFGSASFSVLPPPDLSLLPVLYSILSSASWESDKGMLLSDWFHWENMSRFSLLRETRGSMILSQLHEVIMADRKSVMCVL